ncbi:MAG: prepilin-type N-terminal cleavage/methylation domain-containing protein [bacterium]
MKFLKSHQNRGFTLVELLVVISIISLLSSVVLSALNSARAKGRDARRKSDIHQIQLALELYYDANGSYPPSPAYALPGTQPNNAWDNSADASWTNLQAALSPYIKTLPKDPLENNNAAEWGQGAYHYSYFSNGYGCNGLWYMFVFTLEKTDGRPDPSVTACDGTNFQYGGNGATSTTKTVGMVAR